MYQEAVTIAGRAHVDALLIDTSLITLHQFVIAPEVPRVLPLLKKFEGGGETDVALPKAREDLTSLDGLMDRDRNVGLDINDFFSFVRKTLYKIRLHPAS